MRIELRGRHTGCKSGSAPDRRNIQHEGVQLHLLSIVTFLQSEGMYTGQAFAKAHLISDKEAQNGRQHCAKCHPQMMCHEEPPPRGAGSHLNHLQTSALHWQQQQRWFTEQQAAEEQMEGCAVSVSRVCHRSVRTQYQLDNRRAMAYKHLAQVYNTSQWCC
jgi:hypothetical protein